MSLRLSVRILAVALPFTLACGSDGDGGGGGASGVDRQKLVIELADADVVALCEFERGLYKSNFPSETAYCTYFAFDEDEAGCREEVETCVANDEYENEVDDTWECESETVESYLNDIDPNCTATVADVEACAREFHKRRKAAMNAAECDGALSAAESAEDDIPVCTTYQGCFE